ncbi:MAG: metallophosphoesterase [Capsulimonadaceae bacterium]|nr:metallophosphoesterase [Capsulimonadaceae bacterium]
MTSVFFSNTGGGKSAVRVALVTDTHVMTGSEGDATIFRERFSRAIDAVNAANVDLVLLAGDMSDSGAADQFASFKAMAAEFSAPAYWVPGNHDVGGKHGPGKTDTVADRFVEAYEAIMGPSYWVVRAAALRVIGINSSLLGSGLPIEQAQWSFLEKQLCEPVPAPTLLLMHYPPYLFDADEPGDDYWNLEPAPRARLLALLQRGGICAVLSGHIHRPLNNVWNGIPLITSLPVSFGLPIGKQPEGWTLLSVTSDGAVHSQVQLLDRA